MSGTSLEHEEQDFIINEVLSLEKGDKFIYSGRLESCNLNIFPYRERRMNLRLLARLH